MRLLGATQEKLGRYRLLRKVVPQSLHDLGKAEQVCSMMIRNKLKLLLVLISSLFVEMVRCLESSLAVGRYQERRALYTWDD